VSAINLQHASTILFQRQFIFLCALLFIAVNLLSESVAYGSYLAPVSQSDGPCDFSLQLQKSPYREEYISRLAIESGNYFAYNQDPDVMSDVDDDSFSLFGKTRSNDSTGHDIDSFSKNCLTCHDGSSAIDINAHYRNSPTKRTNGNVNAKDHPIGMDYAYYVAFGKGNFKPIPNWGSKMILIQGKVGRLTCHNPLNQERKHLVMSDVRSALCLTCHNK